MAAQATGPTSTGIKLAKLKAKASRVDALGEKTPAAA
jgi:hypothetical protein